MGNCMVEIAIRHGRDYMTPEDVTEAFQEFPEDEVRLAVLEVFGNVAGIGAEDRDLCAFVASLGEKEGG